MKLISLLFIIVASFAAQAQSIEYTRVLESNHSFMGRSGSAMYPLLDTYLFPLFHNPPGSNVGDSINADLARDFLNIEIGDKQKSIFENVWSTEESPIPQLSDLTYEILHNKDGVLSMALSGEGCGAYCEYFTNHYTYDLSNGKRVRLTALFTDRGKQELAEMLIHKKALILKNAIKGSKRQLLLARKKKSGDEMEEFYQDQMELYEDCLERTVEESPSSFIEYFDYYDFFIKGKTLTIILGRCSAHVNRNIDELWEFTFPFSLKQLKPYLTSYGKKLLNVK